METVILVKTILTSPNDVYVIVNAHTYTTPS